MSENLSILANAIYKHSQNKTVIVDNNEKKLPMFLLKSRKELSMINGRNRKENDCKER